jgi:uncharacterized cysteine cluster protein YcgN (CxxCxxCC family)
MAKDGFWRVTPLQEMSVAQWESLCDGCGKCCLIKLQDEDTQDIVFTDVVCNLFDEETCRCTDYARRVERVPDCVKLTPDNLSQIEFMPPTCAYRLLNEGKDLPDWHPLRTGSSAAMHAAQMSVRGKVIHEANLQDDLEDRVIDWPLDI